MLIITLNLDSVLLLLHNSKLAYCHTGSDVNVLIIILKRNSKGSKKKTLRLFSLKPWPNGVASRPKFSTQLRLLATPFGQGLRALALTCDDLRSL